jgi:hypothetical protein
VSAGPRWLRTVLLALALAFAVGFGIGTWLRCRMEQPTDYIGRRGGGTMRTRFDASGMPPAVRSSVNDPAGSDG